MEKLWLFLLMVAAITTTGSAQTNRCFRGNQDVVFLVDRSGSIKDKNPSDESYDNFVLLKEFINNVIDVLNVGENQTRIGLVAFASSSENIFYLDTYRTKEEVKREVTALGEGGGWTNTSGGLRRVRTEQFSPGHGDRPGAPNACITITDGISTYDQNLTVPEADALYASGASMYAVGITADIDEEELASIGITNHWTSVDFVNLANLVHNLTNLQCIQGDVLKNVCDSSIGCTGSSVQCYAADGGLQVCPCSYDWVAKHCFPQRPATYDARTKGDCLQISHATEKAGPQIELVCPTKGPASGGTMVFIWGKRLDGSGSGRKRRRRQTEGNVTVDFGGNECKVLFSNSTYIECITSPCWKENSTDLPEMDLDLNLLAGGYNVTEAEVFACLPDPVVSDINPLESFVAGGIRLTVTGKYLDSVSKPLLEITMTYWAASGPVNTLFPSECIPHSGEEIFCPTPRIEIPDSFDRSKRSLHEDHNVPIAAGQHGEFRQKRQTETQLGGTTVVTGAKQKLNKQDVLQFYIGLKLDGVQVYRNMSKVKEPLGILTVYWDPDVHHFEEDKRVRVFNSGFPDYHDFLDIKGERLDEGSRKESWSVMVGTERCDVSLLGRKTLTCSPPPQRPRAQDGAGMTRDGGLLVVITVGNLNFYPGYLKYASGLEVPTIKAIAIGVPVALLLLLLLILLVVCGIKRHRKWAERLHLQRIAEIETAVRGNLTPKSKLLEELSPEVRDTVASSLIDPSCVEVERQVGSGYFGVVFSGFVRKENGDKEHVAIKTIKSKQPPLAETIEFISEATVLKQFSHPNVLSLVGISICNNIPKIMTPFMANGDLKSFLEQNLKKLSPNYLVKVCAEVAAGMAHMAEKSFVHRDLAARNVMVDSELSMRIADFGLSRDLHSGDYYKAGDKTKKMPIMWMALESLENGVYTPMTDVWSFGVLMWETWTYGKHPYAGIDPLDMREYLKHNNRLRKPEGCSEQLYNIMRSCWNRDPSKRPKFEELQERLAEMTDLNLRYSKMPAGASKVVNTDPNYMNAHMDKSPPPRLSHGAYLNPVEVKESEPEEAPQGTGVLSGHYDNCVRPDASSVPDRAPSGYLKPTGRAEEKAKGGADAKRSAESAAAVRGGYDVDTSLPRTGDQGYLQPVNNKRKKVTTTK